MSANARDIRPSVQFASASSAVADGSLHVRRVTGREAMSEPYRYDLELISGSADIDLQEVLDNTAAISLRQPVRLGDDNWGTKILPVHGEMAEFEFVRRQDNHFVYRGVLVPRIWKLGLNRVCRIFLEMTVMDIVKEILTEVGLDAHLEDLTGDRSYPTREYVVQYEETDLDFIHRWLEHEGIYYYFKQTESGETIVFGDSTAGYATVEQPHEARFNDRMQSSARVVDHDDNQASFYREPLVGSFSQRLSRHYSKVVLNDYNWRTPSVSLRVEHEADADHGDGTYYEYNAHYKDEGEGTEVARIRGEELMCRTNEFTGTADFRSFHPGRTFALTEHYRNAFNAEYLLVEVIHEAEQELGPTGMQLVSPDSAKYSNSFVAIPAEVPFRPASRAPWPSISGFLNAKIDAGGSGDYAEIDDMGRYKVKFPFDLSDRDSGSASRYVRMSQPYAGGGMGMHFPLHKGTEVLIAFVDGDPDRPVIVGAVPNPETSSPVAGPNQTQCKIATGGGNQIVIEDNDGAQAMTMYSPSGETTIMIGQA